MPALSESELHTALAKLPNWHHEDGKIVRDFSFPDFVQALAFVNQVGKTAESQNHHPDIDIRYNKVSLGLVTHDSGGITRRDLRLAALIDEQFK